MEEPNEIVRRSLDRHGLGADVRELVRLWASPDPTEGAGERGNVTISYAHAGRRRETAMVSLPSMDEAVAFLQDRERIGSLLSLGIGAMPKDRRPLVPAWISESRDAQRVRRDMRRASGLAEAAADGRDVTGGDRDSTPGAPF